MQGDGDERARSGSARRAAHVLLRHHLWRRRRTLGAALAGATVYLAAVLVIPLVAGRAVDRVVVDGERHRFWPFAFALAGLAVVRAGGGAIRKYFATKNPALISNDIRDRLFEHVQRLSFSFHDRVGAGQLMARASTDVTMVEQALSPIPWFTQSSVLFVLGGGILVAVQPWLALSVFVVVTTGIVVALRTARGLYPAAADVQRRLGFYAEFIEQQVQGIRVVKGHGFERQFRARGAELAGDVRAGGLRRAEVRARFQATMLATPGAAMLTILGLGGWLGASGRMTPGELLTFVQYLALLVAPVAAGAELLAQWPQGVAAAERIAEVLAAEPDVAEPHHAKRLPSGGGRIEFDDVTFGYRAGRPVIHGLSLSIEAGESVAFVGRSGSGKTTLVHLLSRFYDPWTGAVRIDGRAVHELRLRDLRHAVSFVFEDTVVFTASIRENLSIGDLDAPPAAVERAARLSEAHRFIAALPDGYDTVVGPQGYSLSGGQRQRLAIARAILRDSRVLVLDDAMSAVDPPTEAAIRRGLVEAMRRRTTLIVAHRVETISLAERIVLLDAGRVIADGPHDDLVDLPAYRAALALDELDGTRAPAGSARRAVAIGGGE
jgi:ATP-binding cassette subfamily B protein